MDEETWRPLGVNTDKQIAEYDALHDGVPEWMSSAFWAWVRDALTVYRHYHDGSGRVAMLDTALTECMCQTLKISIPNLRAEKTDARVGQQQLQSAIATLRQHHTPLQIADYLLAHAGHSNTEDLEAVLERSKSAYEIGVRSGLPGLVHRVPIGVQVAADSVMARAGRAGTRLAKAWEELYGLTPHASEAYRLAILAVEDAAVPVVSPNNPNATLGTVLKQIEDQKNWRLPMAREHDKAPSSAVLIGMLRVLWHGQHDRHGGQPSAPGDVTIDEAQVAVAVAVTLVHWFDAGLIQRTSRTP